MKYEDALKEWGARRIEERYGSSVEIDRDTVKVDFDFDEGYACCGGTDPDCYCSLAESPSASVVINGKMKNDRKTYSCSIDHWSFDFATILKEIVVAGGGTVTGSV